MKSIPTSGLLSKPYLWTLIAVAAWLANGWAQETKTPPQPGATVTIEGEITSVALQATPGPPVLTVRAADGKEYAVRFGPLRLLQRQGFKPKVGDKVTVSGAICCQVDNKTLVHSNSITLGGKTYRTPMTPEQMMQQRLNRGHHARHHMQMSGQPGCCPPGEPCPMCAGNESCAGCSGMH